MKNQKSSARTLKERNKRILKTIKKLEKNLAKQINAEREVRHEIRRVKHHIEDAIKYLEELNRCHVMVEENIKKIYKEISNLKEIIEISKKDLEKYKK